MTHMLWCQVFYHFSLHLVWNAETNTHSISHSKTKCKHSSPSRCPQMANSSTILSGPSLPPDHPHKLPTLFSPNTSTKARSLSTLHSRTPRPTRSVTPHLRRLAAPAQYITHRAPRTPPGQICLPFDYPRFFRTNGCWCSMLFFAVSGSSSFCRSGRCLHAGCERSTITGSRHIGLPNSCWGALQSLRGGR